MNELVWHKSTINQKNRNKLLNQKPFVLWFTGLSASGKSTLSNIVEHKMHNMNYKTYLLDGDNVRHGLNNDLGFDEASRVENIRRVGEVAKLFLDAGVVTFAAFVSPYLKDRENTKDIVGAQNFVEVYVNTSIEECERRDVKGLYKKARAGEIKNMTGIDAPYEPPIHPDIEIVTEKMTIEKSVKQIVKYIKNKITLKNE